MTTPWKFPSKIMEYVDFYTKRYFKNIKYMWTYILKKENGKYLYFYLNDSSWSTDFTSN